MDFAPEQWAHVMKDAGMKYMIFTTKHHDGFCMFDSDYTDFTIADGPFAGDPRSDVALHVFDAFRKEGFMTGFYFSKPDWHCKWYWNPYFATPRRIQNYNIEKHPDWWRNYVEFTQNQLRELMTRYGRCDILWLDGGWVSGEELPETIEWSGNVPSGRMTLLSDGKPVKYSVSSGTVHVRVPSGLEDGTFAVKFTCRPR